MADIEMRSLLTETSRSEISTTALAQTYPAKWKNKPLHERCTISDMVKLKDGFDAAYQHKMLPHEFRDLLTNVLNLEYDDEDFKILFLKMNTDRDGEVSWDELVSHLMLGYFLEDAGTNREALQPPIVGLPTILRSRHRHPVSRICFCLNVAKDRSTDPLQGSYVTASRDGALNWWSIDLNFVRTAMSSSPVLKVRGTWVTDMACLSDVNVVVTSSTERELRFYDTIAKTFTLKILITSWEYMIVTMSYYFPREESGTCTLALGDAGGNVHLLRFSPYRRGPFASQPGRALTKLSHIDLIKRPHKFPDLKLVTLGRLHDEWVRQVWWWGARGTVLSCATTKTSLVMRDPTASHTNYTFSVEKGIQCFVVAEESHMLVTGSPDCCVRVWNAFVPAKPTVIFTGHHAAVMSLVLQDGGRLIYSLSRDRVIKVWDTHAQECIQTYVDIPSVVGERTPISAVYNPATREMVLAAMRLAVLTLDEQLNPHHTDGFTHSRAVAKILYNQLFKVVVTCGMDSIIITWDPFTGRRMCVVREAHIRCIHGEKVPVEITAACFDPSQQLLVTGARDGSLKVWNFNTGVCLREMMLEHMQEVTNVFWIDGRILAVGWNRRVVEFDESGGVGKAWETRHVEDVLAAAVRPPLTLVTTSYSSELVMWKLETGQPYRRFSCTEPLLRIKLMYDKRANRVPSPQTQSTAGKQSTAGIRQSTAGFRPSTAGFRQSTAGVRPSSSGLRRASSIRKPRGREVSGRVEFSRPSVSEALTIFTSPALPFPPSVIRRQSLAADVNVAVSKARARRISSINMPATAHKMRQLAVHAAVFLETRPVHMHVASLMVGIENGMIQGWSDHSAGGFQGAFNAVHTAGDYISALATDGENRFLFSGTTVGYIKVWLMTNYLTNEEEEIHMPWLRLQFPFLWRDRIEGRAKRSVRDQPLPLLLNSYRGHLRRITSIAYIDDQRLLLSGSSDYSVRIWRLSGEYLQTLGGIVPYTLQQTRFPPDVRKVASFTTFKVWRGGYVSHYVPGQVPEDKLRDITRHEILTKTYGEPPPEPLLGHYFKLPYRPDPQPKIELDDSLPTIPLYAHLRMASTFPIRRPPTPELVKKTRIKKLKPRKTHFDGREGAVRISDEGHHQSNVTLPAIPGRPSISGQHNSPSRKKSL